MKTAFVFPGQGSQKPGMGKALFEADARARARFAEADDLLGFSLSSVMFGGTAEELTRTSVTQPSIFLHSVVLAEVMGIQQRAAMVAGHSLGEFSALVAAGAMQFGDGLRLVQIRAEAMQRACDAQPSAMAAIIGLADDAVEELCAATPGVVVPANYNSPGQLVISGETTAVQAAIESAKLAGARLAKLLPVNGAFHSPLMEAARQDLATAIQNTQLDKPTCPVYQNTTARGETDPERIKTNLIQQLTSPVRWTQSVQQMVADGATHFVELGPGKVLSGLVKRIAEQVTTEAFEQ